MHRLKTRTLTIMALCIALNVVGANLALLLRLPIYLDAIGTVLAAAFLGPLGGMATGGLSALLSGATDLYALFYLPVQLLTGLVAGLLYRRVTPLQWQSSWWLALVVSLPSTVVSTLITVALFHGVTSSGSSMLVQLLLATGIGKVAAVFVIQIATDYLDRLITVSVVAMAYRLLRHRLPQANN
ncbi:ECF transporter S component [Lactiplantibacillus plajomi]|uniref:ECF transporter S component n=1 Tax=Lactiplantibacillus plajomi TaxID=1457217 RepID=A0ABV6K3L1_9LACO|nr:ECF transporter S component [Lactiplantibacillus plajomi]